MLRLEQITSEAGIKRLGAEWAALWERVGNACPFQSPQWLLSWWECFGTPEPLIITARYNARLIAILPLYILKEGEFSKLLPIGISLSDYIDALVDPSYPGLAEALLASMAQLPGWDECFLPDLPPSAALLEAKYTFMLSEMRSEGETCPVLPLPQSVEGLRTVVPRKTLRDLRQARRRASAAGGATVTEAEPANVSDLMREFFRLHEARWERQVGQGVCAEPRVRRFHLLAARRMLEAGILRLYVLQVGNSPVAAYYGFCAKRIAYAYLSGFDPDYAELSPGTQIIGHAIEEAIREGAREFHFLRGGEAYKYAWGAVGRTNTTLALTRRC